MPWNPPTIDPSRLVLGDMPGDRIQIDDSHIARANAAFPLVLERLTCLDENRRERLVVSVYGGSGVGKSEIGSILAYYCTDAGYPAYVMSGDNYPHRCPPQNDAERVNVYRAAGMAAIARDPAFADEWDAAIHERWPTMGDVDPALATGHPGFARYQAAGREALLSYLATQTEVDFDLVNAIIARFKAGETTIPLKRMGRTPEAIHFEAMDFSHTRVLIIEWTHGNNRRLQGVDLPIFLYSSPAETLAHRRSRGRDADVDSSFIKLVLQIEQERLDARAHAAAIILGKDGQIVSKDGFPGASLEGSP